MAYKEKIESHDGTNTCFATNDTNNKILYICKACGFTWHQENPGRPVYCPCGSPDEMLISE